MRLGLRTRETPSPLGPATGWTNGCWDAGVPGGSPEEVESGIDCTMIDFGAPGENGFATQPVDDQIIEFEFDSAYDLTATHIWNNDEDGNAEERGVDEFEIQVNTERTGGTFTAVGTTFNLTAANGIDNNSADVIPLVASGVRRVRILLNSALSGIGGDDEVVGLSEVRFEGTLDTLDLAADGGKDGNVGGHDFLLWQQFLGLGEYEGDPNHPDAPPGYDPPLAPDTQEPIFFNSTLTATQSEGDYDNNNVNNAADLAAWEAEYGTSVPPLSGLASASIPEPTAVSLALIATMGSLIVCRRRLNSPTRLASKK